MTLPLRVTRCDDGCGFPAVDRLKTGVPFPVDIDISAEALKEL
ncbi:hypothetical protein OG323_23135 [Streptomyces cyaneofuscatus]|nr:hypothetical protein OG323_23135 [Streptomyces cyaneofuscatus]